MCIWLGPTLRDENCGGEPSAVCDFVDRYGKPWPILLDREREVYDRFFDKGVPAFVVIDPSGHLTFKERGWWSSDREAVNFLAREIERAGVSA